MADVFGNLDFGADFSAYSQSFDAFGVFVLYFFVMIIIGVCIWLVLWYLSFKIKIRIRQHTNSGYFIIDTWARQYKQRKTSIIKWRFLKPAQHIAPPPEGFVEITKKGRFSAECDRSMDGTVVWRRPSSRGLEVDVFSAEERTMIIHELREAETYKKKAWGQVLVEMAPLLAIVMILTIFMLFFSQAVQPTIDLAQSLKGVAETMKGVGDKLESVCLERPVLEGTQGVVRGVPN